MADIKVGIMPRVFSYKGQDLPDPSPKLTIKEVISHYSGQYPELTNGFEKSSEMEDGKMVIHLETSVGVKG